MVEESITTADIAQAVRKLADHIEASEFSDGSVVCFIRVESQSRLYAIGDDLIEDMVEAAVALEASIEQAEATRRKEYN